VTTTQCLADGSRDVTVDVALTLDAPADVATYTPYVAGGQTTEPGTMRFNVLLYAPTGGRIEDVTIEGAEPGVTSQVHEGLSVVGKTLRLSPGTPVSLTYHIIAGAEYRGDLVLRTTPLERTHSSQYPASQCP